jgi:hypothetical protein
VSWCSQKWWNVMIDHRILKYPELCWYTVYRYHRNFGPPYHQESGYQDMFDLCSNNNHVEKLPSGNQTWQIIGHVPFTDDFPIKLTDWNSECRPVFFESELRMPTGCDLGMHPRFQCLRPATIAICIKMHDVLCSLDWFKGKSTGNHGFYHQI